MNIVNPISKKVFNYVINAFTDIEGVTFEENDFKLEVTTLINKYYKEQKFIDLNKVQVIDVSIVDKDGIQKLGAKGVVEINNQLKIIFDKNAKQLKRYISEIV